MPGPDPVTPHPPENTEFISTDIPISNTEATSRRNWQKDNFALVREVTTRLTDLYRTGELREEIRPKTLKLLGGDFAALYYSLSSREQSPAWMQEYFPSGFQSLVDTINDNLARDNIEVTNTKVTPCRYRKLPQDARKIIRTVHAQYQAGEISASEALYTLENGFEIELTKSQVSYYFPQAERDVSPIDPLTEKLEERKRQLASRLEQIKKELRVELSIHSCVKGLVFESFIGVCLADRFGASNIEAQKQQNVAYKDLNGIPHTQVYLDYHVTGDEPAVYEVKFRNDFNNILTSVLPQLYALERSTGKDEMITVVYRHPCPLTRFAVDRKIKVEHLIREMDLMEIVHPKRPLDQIVRYQSVEEFLNESDLSSTYQPLLTRLDAVIQDASTTALREAVDCFTRIAHQDNHEKSSQIEVLLELLESSQPIPPAKAKRLFGDLPQINGTAVSHSEKRIQIIQRAMQQNRDKLLLEFYKHITGVKTDVLSEKVLQALEALDPQTFEDAALQIFVQKEEYMAAKMLESRTGSVDNVESERLISSYERVAARLREDRVEEIVDLKKRLFVGSDGMMRRHNRVLDIFEALSKESVSTSHQILNLFKKHKIKIQGGIQQLGYDLVDAMNQSSRIEGSVYQMIQAIHEQVKAGIRQIIDRKLVQDRYPVDSEALQETLQGINEYIETQRKILQHHPGTLAMKALQKKIKNNRSVHKLVRQQINGLASRPGLELASLLVDLTAHYFDSLNLYAAVTNEGAVMLLCSTNPGVTKHTLESYPDYMTRQYIGMLSTQLNGKIYSVENEELLSQTSLDITTDAEAARQYLKQSLARALIGITPIIDAKNIELDIRTSYYNDVNMGKYYLKYLDEIRSIRNSLTGDSARGELASVLRSTEFFIDAQRTGAFDVICHAVCALYSRSTALAKHLKLKKAVNRLPAAEVIDYSLTEHSLELIQFLDEHGILGESLRSDFFARKVQQASIIGFFSSDLAIEFIINNNPDSSFGKKTLREADECLRPLREENDKLFEALVS